MNEHQPDGTIKDYMLVRTGKRLSAKEATALQRKALSKPDDVKSRLFLLGYLEKNRPKSATYAAHLIWFIDNRPNDFLHELVLLRNNSLFQKGKNRWLRQIRLNPSNTQILYNTARFCQSGRTEDAVKFLRRASQLASNNEDYHLELAHIYSRMFGNYSPRKNKALAQKVVEQATLAINCYAIRNTEHSYLLQYFDFDFEVLQFAEVALTAGLLEEAKELGSILLNRKSLDRKRLPSKDFKRILPGAYGRSTNFGNSILGRVALASGDTKVAKACLSRMTLVSSDWFADWKLADQLLEAGEHEVVVDYIEHCRQFWEQMVNDFRNGLPNSTGYLPANLTDAITWEKKTRSWITAIRCGQHPQFIDKCDC